MLKMVQSVLYKRLLLLCFCWLCLSLSANDYFRAVWIATVANIDWPSAGTVGQKEKQQTEMIGLLDSLQSLGINAIIFQVRPTADALYYSKIEPHSHWSSGTQGHDPGYDILQFVVEQAHQRQIEVHAWLNPYRATLHSMDTTMLAPDHVMRRHPDWFFRYGKQWYFNPGLDETRQWICDIVEDIVCRYDIDAIHMDDYFYPYPIAKTPLPDEETFRHNSHGFTNIEDWRRDNVNRIIESLSHIIHTTKPDVQFGISPFGVWRNKDKDPQRGSDTRAGMTNYDDLYADVLLWIQEGWIDYVVPQLYWEIGKTIADYEVLAHWWADHSDGCLLYIGMAPYRLGSGKPSTAKQRNAWREGNEIVRQMNLNRTIPQIRGECFYSTRPLLRNPLHVCDSIRQSNTK